MKTRAPLISAIYNVTIHIQEGQAATPTGLAGRKISTRQTNSTRRLRLVPSNAAGQPGVHKQMRCKTKVMVQVSKQASGHASMEFKVKDRV